MISVNQVVDPAVSRIKFDEEIAAFRSSAALHQRRGWLLIDAEFPSAFVIMAASQIHPPAIVCGVHLDFTNYDVEPPSVVLADPFTREPYPARALPTALLRKRVMMIEVAPGQTFEQVTAVPLLQAAGPDDVPFLCIPGVREYHAHPAHTGDSWLSHRGQGDGTLFAILNTIYQYGVQPISEYQIGLRVMGFQAQEPPL